MATGGNFRAATVGAGQRKEATTRALAVPWQARRRGRQILRCVSRAIEGDRGSKSPRLQKKRSRKLAIRRSRAWHVALRQLLLGGKSCGGRTDWLIGLVGGGWSTSIFLFEFVEDPRLGPQTCRRCTYVHVYRSHIIVIPTRAGLVPWRTLNWKQQTVLGGCVHRRRRALPAECATTCFHGGCLLVACDGLLLGLCAGHGGLRRQTSNSKTAHVSYATHRRGANLGVQVFSHGRPGGRPYSSARYPWPETYADVRPYQSRRAVENASVRRRDQSDNSMIVERPTRALRRVGRPGRARGQACRPGEVACTQQLTRSEAVRGSGALRRRGFTCVGVSSNVGRGS